MGDEQERKGCVDGLLGTAEQQLRLIEKTAGVGAFELDLTSNEVRCTQQAASLFAVDFARSTLSLESWERAAFVDDVPKFRVAIDAATESGVFAAELRIRHPEGGIRWLACKGETLRDGSGRARWLQATCSDITDRKSLEARLLAVNETLEARAQQSHEEARILEVLNRTGIALAAELDLQRLAQMVTDASIEIAVAKFAAVVYNVINHQGEAYTLYTVAGAPREAFADFPMARNAAVFDATFRGSGPVRSSDILADPRYQDVSFHGMPNGHFRVRSYLAVPIVSRSGGVLGGLFLGHPEPGMFTERAERLIIGLASQAAIAIDNARLYQLSQQEVQARKQTQQTLQVLNWTLAQRISERTGELETSVNRLGESERRFRLLVEAVTDYAIYMLDPAGNIVQWNPGAERIKGYTAAEIMGRNFSCFYTNEDRRRGGPENALSTASLTGKYEGEGWRVRKDGSRFWASVVLHAIHAPTGELLGFAKVTRDLTERRASEERLRQAQKMEAIGQLTGGVAHDFNNLLTVISGNMETLQRRLSERRERDLERLVHLALHASSRAATLTHQLLAFSRRQPLQPTQVSVNTLITRMSEMLRRLLPESISIETVLAGGVWQTFIDANQLENGLLNLVVNARDAMPAGGSLTIEAANVYLDESYATDAEVRSGQYVGIFVSDTGIGMTEEVISKAFDPFFTTKDFGHGTGLGLSQVYGFVKQSGGHVKIYSEVGTGTTVKLYLPRLPATDSDTQAAVATVTVPRATGETVLVVEDEPDVRSLAVTTLRELGYRVLAAEDAQSGLSSLDADRDISLLLTDIGLPGGMNGRQLADEARRRRSGLKVLFMSGYARNAIVHQGRLDPGVQLLMKPFSFAGLAAKVRQVLEGT